MQNGIQNPYEEKRKQQHILQIYSLYLRLDEEESKKSERKFWFRPIFQVERRIPSGTKYIIYSLFCTLFWITPKKLFLLC